MLRGAATRHGDSKSLTHLGGLIENYVEGPMAAWLCEYLAACHDPIKVYVTPALEVARADAGEHGGSVYEVEPSSEPEFSGIGEFMCAEARVVRVVEAEVPPFSLGKRLTRLRGIAEDVGASLKPEPTARLLFYALKDGSILETAGFMASSTHNECSRTVLRSVAVKAPTCWSSRRSRRCTTAVASQMAPTPSTAFAPPRSPRASRTRNFCRSM